MIIFKFSHLICQVVEEPNSHNNYAKDTVITKRVKRLAQDLDAVKALAHSGEK